MKKEKKVHENLSLEPISEYNKTKMVAEKVILSFKDKIKTVILRPATVCGFSKNQRLDVTVNMLTYQAIKKKEITVFGGSQTRPNIHMNDMIRIYEFFMKNKYEGIYNLGFENYKILDIAKKIASKEKIKIKIKKSNDIRSYNLDSSKIQSKGFSNKHKFKDAINELKEIFRSKMFKNKRNFYRVKWLKSKLKNKSIII